MKARRVRLSVLVIDLIVLVVLVGMAAASFGPAYGDRSWLLPAFGGAAVGGALVAAVAWLRGHWTVGIGAVALGYLLLGPILALPSTGPLPSANGVRQLVVGAINSWQQMLTVGVPVGSSGALLVPVYLSAVVCAAVALAIAARTSAPTAAVVGPLMMLVVAALMGTSSGPDVLLVGGVVTGVGLLWASWRTRMLAGIDGGGMDVRRPVSALLVVGAGVAAAVWVAPSVHPEVARTVLRDQVQVPFDPRQQPSPLAGFRNYVKNEAVRQRELFTVVGLPIDTRIKLAVLDAYDGVEFTVSPAAGPFTRIGDRIPDSTAGVPVHLDFTIGEYSDIWLPTVGQLTGISFGGPRADELTQSHRYSRTTGTAVVTTGLAAGDTYQVEAVMPVQPSATELTRATVGTVILPNPAGVPDAVKSAAAAMSEGQESPAAKAEAIRAALVEKGLLSHGDTTAQQLISPSGHSAYRLMRLLADPKMVGDEEQFAPAMTLMARSLGMPARVVLGFRPPEKYAGSGPLTVTGGDLSAWAEIHFEGIGWVPFDPTPDEEEIAQQPESQQPASVKPQNLQAPPPPEQSDEIKASDVEDAEGEELPEEGDEPVAPADATSGINWALIGLAAGLPLLLIVLPVTAILAVKAVRRRRRRTGDAIHRVTGAWSEMVDTATDFGFRPEPSHTRVETAHRLAETLDPTGRTVLLADRVDAKVFGPSQTEPAVAEDFWITVDEVTRSMADAHPWHRRWRARLSLASLRRRGGS